MAYVKHSHWLIGVIGILFLTSCTGSSSDTAKPAVLVGDYHIIGGERAGTPIDQHELDAVITIREQTITAYDKEQNKTFAATYTLDTKHMPWKITMISTKAPETGVISKGLIEAEGDKIRLIYALPNGQPPTDFKTGEQQQMFVLVKTDAAMPERGPAPAGM
ncbi:MAG: TIGR03067 domain-containing protein [Nitrospira sp.]|nr:TIGR03067 domain-containing protein [Nitrospira sp.]